MAGTSTTRHRKDALCTLRTYIQTFGKILGSKIELVIIHKAVRACVVGRVDINHLHLAAIRFYQMLQRVQVVAADINILAVAVLGLGIVLLVGTNERGSIHVGEHTSIVFAQPVETGGFVGQRCAVGQRRLKSLYVKLAVSIEALRKVPPEHFHLLLPRRCISVVSHDVLYHNGLFF